MKPGIDGGHVNMKIENSTLAAVDLGSNSFRLQIARIADGQIYPLDSLKETVRLAAGLTDDRLLDEAAQLRALAALSRFSERLRKFPVNAVRAVGTNTLRVAKNSDAFLRKAEATLGFPIEIIAGREEARLIYLGAAHSLPPSTEKRLVIDIGGGSTELIIGNGLESLLTESLYMGCVGYSAKFFPGGKIDKRSLERAELTARNELQILVRKFTAAGWSEVAGSSGTIKALATLIQLNGFSNDGITADGLKLLRAALLKAGDCNRLQLAGMRPDRAPVLAGGFAILSAIFAELGLTRMIYAPGALREGVLYDLIGRAHHHDMREVTVDQFMRRYHVDANHAKRVATLSCKLFQQIAIENPDDLLILKWAAKLHEIGLSIAYRSYHKHSAYIVQNADMPGFSQMEQVQLSQLLLAHRGKLSKMAQLLSLPKGRTLIFCLRLSTLFYRSRNQIVLPEIVCRSVPRGFELLLDAEWLATNSLTATALSDEAAEWEASGHTLVLKTQKFVPVMQQ